MRDISPTHSTRLRGVAGLLFALTLGCALLAMFAAACGDGGDEVEPEPDPEPESNAPAGVVMTPPPGATEVAVMLTEFNIDPEPAEVPAGEVYFLATNAGGEAHELVVIKSDEAAADLPTDDDGAVPEADVDMIGEIEPFAPGSDASITFDLQAGNYVLICNIVEEEATGNLESHYEEGMYIAFTVS